MDCEPCVVPSGWSSSRFMTNSRIRIYLPFQPASQPASKSASQPVSQPASHPGRPYQTADRLKHQPSSAAKKAAICSSIAPVQRCIRFSSHSTPPDRTPAGAAQAWRIRKRADLRFATSLTHAAVSTLAVVRRSHPRCRNLHLSFVSISF